MNKSDFPGCCGAKVISNFGEQKYAKNEIEMKREITSLIASIKRGGGAFVCITTNNLQEHVNSLLPTMGFLSSGPMERNDHAGRFITLWWKPLKAVRKPRVKRVKIETPLGAAMIPVAANGEEYSPKA